MIDFKINDKVYVEKHISDTYDVSFNDAFNISEISYNHGHKTYTIDSDPMLYLEMDDIDYNRTIQLRRDLILDKLLNL